MIDYKKIYTNFTPDALLYITIIYNNVLEELVKTSVYECKIYEEEMLEESMIITPLLKHLHYKIRSIDNKYDFKYEVDKLLLKYNKSKFKVKDSYYNYINKLLTYITVIFLGKTLCRDRVDYETLVNIHILSFQNPIPNNFKLFIQYYNIKTDDQNYDYYYNIINEIEHISNPISYINELKFEEPKRKLKKYWLRKDTDINILKNNNFI